MWSLLPFATWITVCALPGLREHARLQSADRGGRWQAVLALAARQHGVVSLSQLLELGFSSRGVRSAVAYGRLHRIHRGVYAVGRRDLPPNGLRMAAVLACGEGAVLSHVAAAALHGVLHSAAQIIDVTIPRAHALSRHRIRVHRSPELAREDVTVIDGIPVTSLSRTLLDLAATHREDRVESACHQAVVLEIFDMNEMSGLLRRSHGRRGIRGLRSVLERGDLGQDVPASRLERRYRDLCARDGLPKPEINRWILLGDEYHKVDFLWRKERVVIETDGGRYHSDGWKRRRDARRDALLDKHGWGRARIPDEELDHHPARAVDVARRLLAAASDRER